MTKRLTIALVAVALFVLMAVSPVAAAPMFKNGTIINQGATVFIGEQGLNVTHALNAAYYGVSCGAEIPCEWWNEKPPLTQIGWWASAADIYNTPPSQSYDLETRYYDFMVAPSDFVGFTGNWYLLDKNGRAYSAINNYDLPYGLVPETCGCDKSGCVASLVFTVKDPSLDIRIWDFSSVPTQDVTGKSVPQGEKLGFRIDTNMYAATDDDFRANAIDLCPIKDDYEEMYVPVKIGTCEYCYDTEQVLRRIDYSDGVGWATWSSSADEICYTMRSEDRWWDDVTDHWYRYVDGSSGSLVFSVQQDTPYGYFQNDECGSLYLDPTTPGGIDGFINLKVKDESGAQLSALYNSSSTITGPTGPGTPHSVLKNFVSKQPFFWGAPDAPGKWNWDTGALDQFNQYAYPVGTYTISAESLLNRMKDNYKQGGADYTGKTVSQAYTITLVSDTVKIEANKDSVVRSKTFSVTVTGRPLTTYYLWVKGTSTMEGTYDDQPPMIVKNQVDVNMDKFVTTKMPPNPTGYAVAVYGNYLYENGAGATILDDVAQTYWTEWGTREYALIKTNPSGVRTIEFLTTNWTKAQKYTIRVEQQFATAALLDTATEDLYGVGTYKNDEVDVKVEKGAVTIVAAGDQSYYLGEEIKFSGTNTETYKTYLFIVGPNLPDNGANIGKDDPRHYPTETNDIPSFKVVDVNGDNTWSWKWGTANYALDAGTYTIYAVSQPSDKSDLEQAAYGTVSIIIKKPFVSATASQSTVAKGDRVYITGTAEGDPNSVMIWILGKNFYTKKTESVNSDASFKFEVTQGTTAALSSGQYFVVVQHPMQNTKFDVDTVDIVGAALNEDNRINDLWVYNLQLKDNSAGNQATKYTKIFKLGGAGSLQGSDAAEALVQGINDANVDDTYTKLQFLVEEPVVRIDPIGDKHVGDKFTITAQTNLAVDDEVLVQVYSSSFKPTDKSQSGEFSGATGTVKVTKGDSGMNKISFDIDSSTFKPDEYIVTAEAVIQEDATGTALFNVLETPVVTATPVVVVTTAAPTPVPTPVITTATPTPTPTKSPGYGALIALIGLGAVAFIVVRRH
jgi:PGF-CTERM protein